MRCDEPGAEPADRAGANNEAQGRAAAVLEVGGAGVSPSWVRGELLDDVAESRVDGRSRGVNGQRQQRRLAALRPWR